MESSFKGGTDSPVIPPTKPEKEPEQRQNLRVPLRVLRVETELKGEVFFGYAINLSVTGIFIQTSSPKEVGTQFRVRFSLPRDPKIIECLTEVVWSRHYTGKTGVSPGMGLRFIDLNPECQEAIAKFISQDG